MKIYVGNLAYDITEDELTSEFGVYGKVDTVSIPFDRDSGRPRGFAFVEMPTKSEGVAAIAALNGKSLKNRNIVVNEARPREDNRGGGGSYGNRSGGYRSGGGGYGGNRGGGRSGGSGGGNRRRF